MQYTNFLNLVKYLKTNLTFAYPVQIRRVNLRKGLDGDCRLKNKKFLIRVERKLPEFYAIDVVIHELSHALSWNKEDDIHGLIWGKAYSLVYRKFLEWHAN